MNRKTTIHTSIQSKSYDLASNKISRLVRINSFARIVPVGNLSGGPGVRCLLVLFLLHTFGHPLYWLNARYGSIFTQIRAKWQKR